MNKRKVSEVLIILRTEKEISQESICMGLCSKATYCKYENGERQPDRLVLNAFIQRLGKNADKMTTILTTEEYNYFCWKKEVLIALSREDMPSLQQLLEEPEAVDIVVNENLQKQFLYQMQAVVSEYTGKAVEERIRLLEQAIDLTMPDMQQGSMKQYLISTEEMEILLKLAEYYVEGNCQREAEELLMGIVNYIEQHYSDDEIKVKIYPHAVKICVQLLTSQKRLQEGSVLCKKAIDLLCRQGVLFHLMELLELYLESMKGFSRTEEVIRYEKQLQALREVYEEYHAENYRTENMWLSYSNQEMYLLDEVIKRSRMNREMSQEALSDGICATETLSRIESGRRTPTTRNFRALMKRLETGLDYYNGELDTADFLLLEKKQELNRAISLRNWAEAHDLVQYLKERLDMDSPKNQTVLQANENCILFHEGKLKLEEFLKCCEQAMNCEEEGWREERFWKQFFTRYKVSMMNYIACIYKEKNQVLDAIFILEHLLEQLNRSKVKLVDRYKSSITVIGNLSSFYGENGEFDKCLEMCKIDMDICLQTGRGQRLGKFLGKGAEAINDKAGRITENSRRYFEWSYHISELFSVRNTAAYADEYYRTHYEKDIKWYY